MRVISGVRRMYQLNMSFGSKEGFYHICTIGPLDEFEDISNKKANLFEGAVFISNQS